MGRKPAVVYGWENSCPVCGEVFFYHSEPQSYDPPEPAFAECGACGWTFTETSEHHPRTSQIKKYRRQTLGQAKKLVRKLEKLSAPPKQEEK